MTTFRSGNLSAVYVDKVDASQFLNSGEWSSTIDTAETTHFGNRSKEYIVGQYDGKASFGGMYDATPGVVNPSADAILLGLAGTTANFPVSFFPDGGVAVGRRCRVGTSILGSYAPSAPVGGVVTVKFDCQLSKPSHGGYCLTDGVALTTAQAKNYTSVDNGSLTPSTPNGILANIHVPANTWSGITTVKVQHSTDNSVWVDLITQVVPASTVGAYNLSSVGGVNRYVRAMVTTATGSGSVTVIVAFARN